MARTSAVRIAKTHLGKGEGPWRARHVAALQAPRDFERGIVPLLVGWATYADEHYTRFESVIGDDYVLGPEWAKIGDALLGLLNGELGRLDGGSLDGAIREILRTNGVEIQE